MYFRKSLIAVLYALCALLAVFTVSATGFDQAPHVKVVNGFFYPELNETQTGSTNATERSVANTTSNASFSAEVTQSTGTGGNNTMTAVVVSPATTPLVTPSTVSNATPESTPSPVSTPVIQGNTSVQTGQNTTVIPTPVPELTPISTPTVIQTEQGPLQEASVPEGGETGGTSSIPDPTYDTSDGPAPSDTLAAGDDLTIRLSGEFPFSAEGLSEFARMKAFPPLELIERLIGASLGTSIQDTASGYNTFIEEANVIPANETASLV